MFNNKKIAVLGLGIEGLTSAEFLKKQGADVTILDQKIEGDLDAEILEKAKGLGVSLQFGKTAFEDLDKYDILVRSPGIKRDLPEIVKAEKKDTTLTSQIKLFFKLCPCKIIGITGTKGKGTTSSLIYEMLKKSGKDVYLGGNIGKPPFTFLDNLNAQSIVVLELSSFQLQDLTMSPYIAVMLMTTSEHLDRWENQNYHENLKEYIDAKRNILRFQKPEDFAILNKDYPASNESDIHTEGKIYFVSRELEVEQGCYVKNGKIMLRMKDANDVIFINTKDILLPGKHNLENVCAAILAATIAGAEKKAILDVLKTFKGLEHRLELVAEVAGVKYYDDSFSTVPETAIAAIESFANPEILILGGSSKNSDFTEFAWVLKKAENLKAVIGIGQEWERIKEKLQITNYKLQIVEGLKNMHEIVAEAVKIAEPGDIVLLSPACASFDMFKNYKERGNQFKEEVRKLAA